MFTYVLDTNLVESLSVLLILAGDLGGHWLVGIGTLKEDEQRQKDLADGECGTPSII
jgi:hypothetical protein